MCWVDLANPSIRVPVLGEGDLGPRRKPRWPLLAVVFRLQKSFSIIKRQNQTDRRAAFFEERVRLMPFPTSVPPAACDRRETSVSWKIPQILSMKTLQTSLLSVKYSFLLLPDSTNYNVLFQAPVPPEILIALSGRGCCSCPLVKITAANIQPEMQRRNRETGSVDQPSAFGLCCSDRAPHTSCLLLPHSVARGRGAEVSTGPSRGPRVRNYCCP